MWVRFNPDHDIVDTVRGNLKKNGGYCPCKVEKSSLTKCMCQEFKSQIDDPSFEGLCQCGLYYKGN